MRTVCCLIALAVASASAGTATATPAKPELRIARTAPLLIAGSAFRAGEVVRVQALGTFGTRSVRVRSTAAGSFRLRFPLLSGDPCVLRRVTAVGSRGSHAVLRLPPGACADG